ncbi:tetratricopeptide repeat protein [uncultured Desulfovibrio sp.]|uniref:Tetratricopeptide repeat protein n=1 Tax=Candidatus Desulfovibrio intestinavium TaxID=2838534 RepID=A0A9D2KR63_9BACT|nr:tetratricopeptide repeat protein [uncultured Desulfovibrio sp.]HJA79723.1 tetratricopeptide repeat protein [Candidatus Desulfovibrio intestinavium]
MSNISAPQTASSRPQQQPEVRGVFSTQEIRKVGTGTTTRKTVQKTFWFVEQHGDVIECQPLNTNYVPSGPKRKISMEDLIAKFSPEPEFYMNSVYPKMQELQQSIKQGDKYRENGEGFAAEYEYSRALKVDEDNVRANFGIGLTYLERGDAGKAQDIFERLVKLDAAFEPQHKHLFNEFGINLRKNKMLAESREYYARALQLSPKDENLNMNMARVLLESRDLEGCVDYLLEALRLAPRHEPSLKFLRWLIQKDMAPADKMEAIQQALAAAGQGSGAATPEVPSPGGETPAADGSGPAVAADAAQPEGEPSAAAPGTATASDPFVDTTA